MPLYDYGCSSCGHVFELRQSFTAEPEAVCPRCDGKARRKFHAVPIIYKGSGFYTTDYKHTGYSPASGDSNGHSHGSSSSDSHGHEEGSEAKTSTSSTSD